jgi:16S rRNA (uracil1498-N3)-methyltransferase
MGRAHPEEAELNLRRFHCSQLSAEGAIELDDAAVQHIRVLRLVAGDVVQLFDGTGHTVDARIEQVSKARVSCLAVGPVVAHPPGPELVLVQCLAKGKKLDEIVRMTTELGVSSIQLAVSEHCVVQKSERDEHKVERLLRVATEAARQSEQPYVPHITEPASLQEVLARAPLNAARIALAERSEQPLSLAGVVAPLWLVVGPEGGLSSRDRGILRNADFSAVGLGRAILRTETAAVVGVALGLSALGRHR